MNFDAILAVLSIFVYEFFLQHRLRHGIDGGYTVALQKLIIALGLRCPHHLGDRHHSDGGTRIA